jgi:predicted lipoprotein with Yx(FWY)xxD motif
MGRTKTSLLAVIVLAFLAVVWSGIALAQDEKETIAIAEKAGVGKYLVSSTGRTLYYFKNDSPGKSTCIGPCAEKWPVYCYKTDQIAAGKGLKMSDFGSFSRKEDNLDHLTYKGIPLYRFSGDENPGDTNGQGVKGVWFVAKP